MNNVIAEYAIRYCITRQSYAFTDGLDLANREWFNISESTRADVLAACLNRTPHPTPYAPGRWPNIDDAIKSQGVTS